MSERYFPEGEAGRILERAARLQSTAEEATDRATLGVSMTDLQRIADEVGILPRYLDQAVAAPTEPRVTRSWLNLVEEREAIVFGELTDEGWEEVDDAVRSGGRFFTNPTSSRSRTYNFGGGLLANGRLEVVSRKGRTSAQLRSSAFFAYFAGLHSPLILAVSVGIPLIASGWMTPTTGGLFIAGMVLVGLGLFKGILKRTRSKADRLFAQVVDAIGREARPALADPGLPDQGS